MKTTVRGVAFFVLLSGFQSCEEPFVPEVQADLEEIVVEGYIEAGDQPAPPYIILTKSLPFFSKIGSNVLDNIFVHDAHIEVRDGTDTVLLTELCLEALTPEQQALAGAFFGFDPDSLGFNFCVYTDLSFSMIGEAGKSYALTIRSGEREMSAVTTIPPHVPLDSFQFVAPPGEPSDTLAQLRCFVTDPGGTTNFYRYFTQEEDGPFLSPFTSVSDDRLFNGQNFEFPLPKAEAPGTEFDVATFGLYLRGSSITIKWANLDEAHFDFWNTLEFNAANQGPFSSYTRVASNVDGALGVWGGISASYYEVSVPK